MIKIHMKDVNTTVNFEYSEQTTVNNIREFVAEKLKCQYTALIVRKRGQVNTLPVDGTFGGLGILPNYTLNVFFKSKTSNLTRAAKRVVSGRGKSSRAHDISAALYHNHVANINHHEATHEQLENIQNTIQNGFSVEESLEGETINEAQKRLRDARTDINHKITRLGDLKKEQKHEQALKRKAEIENKASKIAKQD